MLVLCPVSAKPAVRVEQELGENTHDFWVPPLRYNGGTLASAGERKTEACVSRVRTVAGWHDKGGMETYMGREEKGQWLVLIQKVGCS